MDKEISCINNILLQTKEGLSTSDISKMLFEKYQLKISRTIVKNYLWSYFRNLIEYNSSDYTYKLKSDTFLIDDIEVIIASNSVRSLFSTIEGNKIIVKASDKLHMNDLIKGIGILNFKVGQNKKNIDLLKQLNRIIEQFSE